MSKKVRVRDSKEQSFFGLIGGCIFSCIGLFVAIPTFGAFGLLWTAIAIGITVTHGYNAFSEKGIATAIIDVQDEAEETVEQRLKKLDDLYQKQLITQEEYNTKRQDILKDI